MEQILKTLQLDSFNVQSVPRPAIFIVFILLSWLIGRYTPSILYLITARFTSSKFSGIYEDLIEPIKGSLRMAGTMILVSLSMVWLQVEKYQSLHDFFSPFVDLAVTISVAWFISRIFSQFIRIYGIELLKKLGLEVDELLLVFETVINVVIGFIAVLAFAQSQRFNLIGLLASLGIGGLAIAFAAQKILEQLLSTIVLYLDRPFVPGDYIRLSNGQLGRVESVGLRSSKIRASGKNTLFIVPNSNLISMEIENITRAKKVMVLLYLDFQQRLDEEECALVRQVVSNGTDAVFGIDPGSTNISFVTDERGKAERARVTFFILGSNQNSIKLRKRLLELANQTMSEKLASFGISFTTREPTVYVESPVTI
ncbi:MAG: mechanosensitive ion channel domain-containing protein [Elainellaceae cyanobacterium]